MKTPSLGDQKQKGLKSQDEMKFMMTADELFQQKAKTTYEIMLRKKMRDQLESIRDMLLKSDLVVKNNPKDRQMELDN